MDPITILGALSSAAQLTGICLIAVNKLYQFAGDVRAIQDTLSRIENEVTDMDRTLTAVNSGLSQPSVNTATMQSKAGQDILAAVHRAVARSTTTLKTLSSLVQSIADAGADKAVLKPLRQAVRSRMKQRELDNTFAEMDKAKQGLTIGLTMLSV
jgi:hypothetical protein